MIFRYIYNICGYVEDIDKYKSKVDELLKLCAEKDKALEILEIALSTGGDFAEVFMENGSSEAFEMTLGKVSQISYRNVSGAAIRIIKGNTEVNTSITDYSYENLKNAVKYGIEQFTGMIVDSVNINVVGVRV